MTRSRNSPANYFRGRFLPLTLQQFHILLALTDGHLHGYAIIRDVADRTAGTLRLGTGTLDTALARLDTLALVEESDAGRRPRTMTNGGVMTG